jgi:hypothetical protein
VTAHINWQILMIILCGPPNLVRGNLRTNSPTEMLYSVLTVVLKVSARTCVSSTLFGNLSCNVFFMYRSAHINEMFMLCVLQNIVNACVKVSSQL